MTLAPEKITELKSKYGSRLRYIETEFGALLFKPPTRAAYDKWQDARLDKTGDPSSNARELAQHCLCEPDYSYEMLISVIDNLPGLLQGEIMTAIGELSGLVGDYAITKL